MWKMSAIHQLAHMSFYSEHMQSLCGAACWLVINQHCLQNLHRQSLQHCLYEADLRWDLQCRRHAILTQHRKAYKHIPSDYLLAHYAIMPIHCRLSHEYSFTEHVKLAFADNKTHVNATFAYNKYLFAIVTSGQMAAYPQVAGAGMLPLDLK